MRKNGELADNPTARAVLVMLYEVQALVHRTKRIESLVHAMAKGQGVPIPRDIEDVNRAA